MRIETKLCVTCHNPGSWVAGTNNTPVDFKVMVHKIHQGAELPSVIAGTPYKIGSADFSTVVFPYSAVALGDTRACAKCHDGTVTDQGDNWKTQPSKAACGSCHDDVYFDSALANVPAYKTVSHFVLSGTDNVDDSMCTGCHVTSDPLNPVVADIEVKHNLPNLLKAEAAKYQFNVVSVENTTAGGAIDLQVVFSVTNPVTGAFYNIKTDPAFACVASVGLPASVSTLVGWNNTDENNSGSGSNPAQPYTASVLDSYSAPNCSNNANVVDLGDGTFRVTLVGKKIPAGVTGSGRASVYGRVSMTGTTERVRVKAAYKDFGITDVTPVARRTVVDVAKCEKCHDQVSLHGESRTNEPGLCVVCHNPNATDVNRRPKTGGIPVAANNLDLKKEESIDFKRMIHAIHAAAKTDYTGATAKGFRDKGLVVYGFGGTPIDFSKVRFPGILNDCTTCHLTGTYELTGNWEVPTTSGVLGSTIDTAPAATDAATLATGLATNADDLNITPTAAVCSACHDGVVAKSHMQLMGALFSATQATINAGATLEACAICHGPGRSADVKVIHRVK
jgi:OmcA/MtrC family decaheme c-type cytochrome